MNPPVPVVRPPVELTSEHLRALDTALAPHLAAPVPGLVVDLSEVTFVSSAGLGALVRVGQRLGGQGAPLVLAAASRRIVRLFQTVGLDRLMPLFGSVGEAQAWVEARCVARAGGAEAGPARTGQAGSA